MNEITPISIVENLGDVLPGVVGAAKSSIESNRAISLEIIKSYEADSSVHRSMLENDSYTFEEKQVVRGWMKEDKAELESIDEKRHERDREVLDGLLALGKAVAVVVIYVAGPPVAKKISKQISEHLPKILKGLKAA